MNELNNVPFTIVHSEPSTIYDLADILKGLREGFDMPELIDFCRGYFGKATILVQPDWFEREFGDNQNVFTEPSPQHRCIFKSIDYNGVEIRCLIRANFVPVAA